MADENDENDPRAVVTEHAEGTIMSRPTGRTCPRPRCGGELHELTFRPGTPEPTDDGRAVLAYALVRCPLCALEVERSTLSGAGPKPPPVVPPPREPRPARRINGAAAAALIERGRAWLEAGRGGKP